MWKLPLVVGGAVGFLLGSRAGRGPYEQLENRVRQLSGRPRVQRVNDQVRESTRQVGDAGAEIFSLAADRAGVVTSEEVNTVADRATDIGGKAGDQFDNGLPINHYDRLTATEVIAKLGSLSQVDLANVDAYERKNANRSTITDRTTSLRARRTMAGLRRTNGRRDPGGPRRRRRNSRPQGSRLRAPPQGPPRRARCNR